MCRERQIEKTEMRRRRKRDICDDKRENGNKIIIYIMQLLSVPCQNYEDTVACCKSLAHLTHLIKAFLVFSVPNVPNI